MTSEAPTVVMESDQMAAKILQISDFHLLKTAADKLRGVPTAACLADVLEFAHARHADADRVVITGDVAAHGDEEAYQLAGALCGPLLPRCEMLPGNHDEPALMRRVLPEVVAGREGPIGFSRAVSGWRLIGLDTQVSGAVDGALTSEQLGWLSHELADHPDEPALLFMHHPPISVGSAWLDRIMLRNPDALAEAIEFAPQVRALFCGHVHQDFRGVFGTVPVYTAPATGIQFTPGTSELQFDDIPPGLRVIEIAGEAMHTYVERLPELIYRAVADA